MDTAGGAQKKSPEMPGKNIIFRKACEADIPCLIADRIRMLHEAVGDAAGDRWPQVEEETAAYYRRAISDGTHVAYLAFDGERVVGTGGVCFYQVLPSYFKPTGQKAYIINMFTHPGYRGRGIAGHILDLLIAEALSRGATYISLEATAAGRPMYVKHGFGRIPAEMQYINETYEGPDAPYQPSGASYHS